MRYFLFAIFSGLLLAGSWPNYGFAPLLLIAFVPLLHIAHGSLKQSKKILLYVLTFLVWNGVTSWWIYNAHWVGMVSAISLNTIMMTLVFVVFDRIKVHLSHSNSNLFLICLWVAMEFLMYRWDLLWPWLTLGNGFANYPNLVQWYEYTGVLGGSIWVLVVNVWFYGLLKKVKDHGGSYLRKGPAILSFLILIVFPLVLSFAIIPEFTNGKVADVVVVQPNVDPYNEKFEKPAIQQMNDFFDLAETKMDAEVDVLIGPETVYPRGLWERNLTVNSIPRLSGFLNEYTDTKVLLGASVYRMYQNKETITARDYSNGRYYDVYNASLFFGVPFGYEMSQKGKLVPGAEMMPFAKYLTPLKALMLDFGGTSGSLGMPDSIHVFKASDELTIASAICYESVCGEYVGKMIQKGANLLAVITNDGWWGDTQGHKQHMAYARLRAIEHRRSVARSANTGISGFILPSGEVLETLEWDNKGALRAQLPLVNQLTFYTMHGDYLGRLASFLSILFLLFALVKSRPL